ncbi:MAG: tryptophan 2,3-dioxygenase family protein [Gammaproteobacteria bacterium]|nr:tryptophan 2,3-dioxygenase family protein [Gammaproteobacteria bacterium]MDH4313829.1 tryptophan 2,3-dioxygenase family protein [Gammaproteobacteria bacterium]MDH5213693.1 tryptophan 2,3-dioxygenase family protein [Gammaproteobacteria bacterium]
MKKRSLESTIHTGVDRDSDYTAYLQLDVLLNAQIPLSDPPHHDEMLFIVQHQVTELWIKLIIHEVEAAMRCIRTNDTPPAVKHLARVKHIQNQIYNQWMVLDTLTPSEYAQFRHVFGKASGFQSPQYRLLEFLLGNKSRSYLSVYEKQTDWLKRLQAALTAPALFDEFLRYLARNGYAIPPKVLDRDFSRMREEDDGVVSVLKDIYERPREHWANYEMCEALMDVGNNFQFWRYHHMKTVERIIGHKRGTGGSSGVSFLKKALESDFFPELITVRTKIGAVPD